MELTPTRVATERDWIRQRSDQVVPILNAVRSDLGEAFETTVDPVAESTFQQAVDEVFADGSVGVNVAALVAILRTLDVENDYPGFVVDDILGRELAATIAGGRPLSFLAEATFHVADIYHTEEASNASAGQDDLDAALAAGFQTRLPGWSWRRGESPFDLAANK